MDVHLQNLADNLQLVADLGYGDVALAVADEIGKLTIVGDARPVTAVTAAPTSRVGQVLHAEDEPEAYEAYTTGTPVSGDRYRTTRGIRFTTSAYPVGTPTYAVIIRQLGEQVAEAPGKMERAFMDVAEELIEQMRLAPLVDVATDAPFVTTRKAGDGLLRLGADDVVEYASPNAINILRSVGVEGAVAGLGVRALPGSAVAMTPVLRGGGCVRAEIEAGERVLNYRTLALPHGGAVVLVEDVTEARRREQELKVKEATIREVHHRVKNNLQTVASLLRIQGRRTENPEVDRALSEAVERIGAMAVVHEMLAAATDETVDLTEAARTVVDMVRQSVAEPGSKVTATVEGQPVVVPAAAATSLALVIAELVHNAIEHGFAGRLGGSVEVAIKRLPAELHIAVRDDGVGLPEGFSAAHDAKLGLAIVKTVVQDDLGGTLAFGEGRGTVVTIRAPLSRVESH